MSGVLWFASLEARRRWLEALLLAALGVGAMYGAWRVNWPEYGRGVAIVLGLVWLAAVTQIWRGGGVSRRGMAWWSARPVRTWERVAAQSLVSVGLLLVAGAGWVSVTRVNLKRASQMEEARARMVRMVGASATAGPAAGSTGPAASLAAGTTPVAASQPAPPPTSASTSAPTSSVPISGKKRHHRHRRR